MFRRVSDQRVRRGTGTCVGRGRQRVPGRHGGGPRLRDCPQSDRSHGLRQALPSRQRHTRRWGERLIGQMILSAFKAQFLY